jgi:hypothetical protein
LEGGGGEGGIDMFKKSVKAIYNICFWTLIAVLISSAPDMAKPASMKNVGNHTVSYPRITDQFISRNCD